MRAWRRLAAGFLLAAGGALALLAQDPEDWSLSPEAYFLTSEERAEWKKLASRDSRRDFIDLYWLKRDPTPGTPKNEFRETVLSRIKTADARFHIATTPGSRTGRGRVFIVLGTPARVQDSLNPQAEAPRTRAPGEQFVPLETAPPNETNSVWTWDRERTPRILEVLGRPSLEIRLVVEPNRRRDQILDPGLFDEIRETLARRSIVNPTLVPPGSEPAAPPESESATPRAVLRPEVRSVLDSAAPASGDGNVGAAVLWKDSGPANALLWAFTRISPKQPRLHALVRAADGSEAASFSEPAEPSRSFSSLTPGFTCVRRLSLEPGSYTANIALTEQDGKVLASSAVPLEVPALQKGFAVSSLVLTRGPADAVPGNDPTFVIG